MYVNVNVIQPGKPKVRIDENFRLISEKSHTVFNICIGI